MGIADETKGKFKEAAGSVTGSDDLRQEGQAQQRKGQEEEKAAEARATAEAHERKAGSFQRVERGHQGT
ncbi:MAG TPA: CsbD family protein [Pseudonocardiaceae bacterium]